MIMESRCQIKYNKMTFPISLLKEGRVWGGSSMLTLWVLLPKNVHMEINLSRDIICSSCASYLLEAPLAIQTFWTHCNLDIATASI